MSSKKKEKKQSEDINILASDIVKKATTLEPSKDHIKKQITKQPKKK